MNSEKKQDMADYYQGFIITQISLNQTGHHDDFLPGLELKLCCCRKFWFRITHSCSCCQCSPKTCRIILKYQRHHCRGAPAQWKREVIITEKSVLIYRLLQTDDVPEGQNEAGLKQNLTSQEQKFLRLIQQCIWCILNEWKIKSFRSVIRIGKIAA